MLVARRRRLRDRRLHVAEVDVLVAQLGDSRIQTGIADRRGTHVNAPSSGSQIERGADDGHFVTNGLQRHGGQG